MRPGQRFPPRLTKRRMEYLRAIDAISARGEPPTYKTIAKIVGVGSTNAVHDALCGLERLGFVILAGNCHRQMRITTKGLSRLGYRTCPCCGSMTRNGFVGGTGVVGGEGRGDG